MSLIEGDRILANSLAKNVFNTNASGSTVGHVNAGVQGYYNQLAKQTTSLQESIEHFIINSKNAVASGALQQTGYYLDFDVPTTATVIKDVHLEVSVQNPGNAAQVWEAPVMPFMIERIVVLQNGLQVGADILPMHIWKYHALVSTLNERKQLETRSTIDQATYILKTSQNLAAAGTRTFAINLAPFLVFCQAELMVNKLIPMTIRITFANISKISPTDTNSMNAGLLVTACRLLCIQKSLTQEAISRISADYAKGHVDCRVMQVKQDVVSYAASSSAAVSYTSNVFNNDIVAYSDFCLANATRTGANLLTFYDITSMSLMDQQGKSIINGRTPTSSELLNVDYNAAFPDSDFNLASLYQFPLLVGSTNCRKSIKENQHLGYRVLPYQMQLSILAGASATRSLIITAWVMRHVRVSNRDSSNGLHKIEIVM
jgi:hypothetical protein